MEMRAKQKIEFDSISKKTLDDPKKHSDAFDFFYGAGSYYEAGTIGLSIGDALPDYLYKVYDCANKLYAEKDYQSAALFYHELYNYAANDYTKLQTLSLAADSYEKTIIEKIKSEGNSDYVKFLHVQLGSVYEHLDQPDKALNNYIEGEDPASALGAINNMLENKKYKTRWEELKGLKKKYENMEGAGADLGYRTIIKGLGRIEKA